MKFMRFKIHETNPRTVEIAPVLFSFVFLFTWAILGSLKRVEPLFVFLKLSLSRALHRRSKEKSTEKQRCDNFDSFYFIWSVFNP